MPPRYLRRASPTRLKPCQERMFETCDTTSHDGCCGAAPCRLCLEWETYDGVSLGTAVFPEGGASWTGTVGGGSFVAYWERNAYDECEFVVTFDGDEVYRATCYEGASCRNPAGEVSASIGYEEGTLRWSVYEPRELALIDNPDTGCRDFFCGVCRCSCECLCVTITQYGGDTVTGEICDTAYDCDPPVWAGTVGYYSLSIALGRNQYGECIITVTSDGEEQDPVTVTGCADMSATVTLASGDVIEVRCKQCGCTQVIGDCICGRSMGETLRLLWSSGNGTHGSAAREFLLYYGLWDEDGITCSPWSPNAFPGYRGTLSGTFPTPMGGTQANRLEVILVCECIGCTYCVYYRWLDGDTPNTWYALAYTIVSCDCPAILDVIDGFTSGETGGYQMSDVTVYELESNC